MRKLVKILGVLVLFISGLLATLILIVNLLGTRSDIVKGITGEKIKEVHLGMKIEKVISILGKPYRINSLNGLHDGKCRRQKPMLDMQVTNDIDIRKVVNHFYNDTIYCCDGNREDKKTKRVTLTYTKPVNFSKYYPMLWVHLNNDYRVINVFAKRYDGFWGLDDPAIYNLEQSGPNILDEEKFANCFD